MHEEELMKEFDLFRISEGRFRISLTTTCNARCWFCHNEGSVPPVQIDGKNGLRHKMHTCSTEEYITLVETLIDLGISRLYFTGGEPLISPKLEPILDSIPLHGKDQFKVILATNGVLLKKKLDSLKSKHIDKLKISLHAFSDESMWNIEKISSVDEVKASIVQAKQIFPEIEINTLLMPENQHENMDIIQFVRDLQIDIEILELVWTDYNRPTYTEKRISTYDLAKDLIHQGGREYINKSGIGVNLKMIDFENCSVRLMDNSLGSSYVGTCQMCPVKSSCVEGFWSIRVDPEGFAQPCLLRSDLRIDLKPLIREPKKLKEFIPLWIGSFMKGVEFSGTGSKERIR
ncbi:cyclic pyranopterin phosphate synthase [Fontibacillus phaseoli]|uniref:Cyclic pyranopterin phosphate synthase n=1 Tax=Fontibacillus phaseoli TaxID=1416533 RepID=A0A369BJ50_9BACL|nr:radical SAM protein [Fontibacillus phaseoli]RCX21603.1 cyclic pyranopterin phosphate synthase [Fontibacillus phaseoli]